MSNYDNLKEAIRFIEERKDFINYLHLEGYIKDDSYKRMKDKLEELKEKKQDIDSLGNPSKSQGISKETLKNIKLVFNRSRLETLYKKDVMPETVQIMGQNINLSKDKTSLRQKLNYYRNLGRQLEDIEEASIRKNIKNSMAVGSITLVKGYLNTEGLTLNDLSNLTLDQMKKLENTAAVNGKPDSRLDAINKFGKRALSTATYTSVKPVLQAQNALHIKSLKSDAHGYKIPWTNKDIQTLAMYIDASDFWKSIHRHNLSSEQYDENDRVIANQGKHQIAEFLDELLEVIRTEDSDAIDDFIKDRLRI